MTIALSKWHIADEFNHGRAACAPNGARDLVVPLSEWVNRPASDKCQNCARLRRTAINQHVAASGDADTGMYFVTVKKVLVTYATVTVRAKNRAAATAAALERGLTFEDPMQDGSLEVVEVVEG